MRRGLEPCFDGPFAGADDQGGSVITDTVTMREVGVLRGLPRQCDDTGFAVFCIAIDSGVIGDESAGEQRLPRRLGVGAERRNESTGDDDGCGWLK
jgi:hypothetical protein